MDLASGSAMPKKEASNSWPAKSLQQAYDALVSRMEQPLKGSVFVSFVFSVSVGPGVFIALGRCLPLTSWSWSSKGNKGHLMSTLAKQWINMPPAFPIKGSFATEGLLP